MFRILFATDGSEDAAAARRLLETLPLPEASVVRLVAVVAEPAVWPTAYTEGLLVATDAFTEIREAEREMAQKGLDRAAADLAGRGLRVEQSLRHGDPAREILAEAHDWPADLVVLGSKGLTGLDAVLLGSVARNVAKHCPRPVLIGRAPRQGLRRVLIGTDGSDHARHALAFAAALPLPDETAFTVAHVVRPYTPFAGLFPTDRDRFHATVLSVREQQRDVAEALVREAAMPLAAAGRTVETEVREGDPTETLLALADEQGADLLIVGARGVSLIEGLRVGSVADRLLKEARCSVLVVH